MNSASMVDNDQLASVQHRSQVFWLLADGLLNGLLTDSWSAVENTVARKEHGDDDPFEAAWSNLLDVLEHAGAETGSRLAIDHTRLFSGLGEGAGPVPPYESAWRTS